MSSSSHLSPSLSKQATSSGHALQTRGSISYVPGPSHTASTASPNESISISILPLSKSHIFRMPPQSDCRYMAMRAISTFPEISPAPISPAIFTSRGDFLGGIGPARESNPRLRACQCVAIPLGRLNPSHRRVVLPLLRDATGPVHFLPTCRPDCLRGKVSIPVPSRQPLIYTAAVYMASGNRISGRFSTISAHLPHRTSNGKNKKATRRASRPTNRHAIGFCRSLLFSCLPFPVLVRTCR